MKCERAQRLFDDLSRDRLPPTLADKVRHHLSDCTDCRVVQQRTARLQRLLALKRYERPAPQYFENFLSEFHTRLRAEPATGLWQRFARGVWPQWELQPARALWYGFASAVGIVLAGGALWLSVDWRHGGARMAQAERPAAITTPGHATVAVNGVSIAPNSPTAATPASLLTPTTAASTVAIPALARTEPGQPRYVLDRITVAPASYEVASIRF